MWFAALSPILFASAPEPHIAYTARYYLPGKLHSYTRTYVCDWHGKHRKVISPEGQEVWGARWVSSNQVVWVATKGDESSVWMAKYPNGSPKFLFKVPLKSFSIGTTYHSIDPRLTLINNDSDMESSGVSVGSDLKLKPEKELFTGFPTKTSAGLLDRNLEPLDDPQWNVDGKAVKWADSDDTRPWGIYTDPQTKEILTVGWSHMSSAGSIFSVGQFDPKALSIQTLVRECQDFDYWPSKGYTAWTSIRDTQPFGKLQLYMSTVSTHMHGSKEPPVPVIKGNVLVGTVSIQPSR